MSAREGRNLPSPSEGTSIRLRDVVGIVVAAVFLRAALEILAGSVYRGDAYYWSLLFQLVMYGVMFALLRRDALIVGVYDGSRLGKPLIVAIALATAFVGVTVAGQQVIRDVASHVGAGDSLTPAAVVSHGTYSMFSARVMAFVVVTCLVAPFVEEAIFRGVLIGRGVIKGSNVRRIVVSSLIFAAFHALSGHIVNAFIFSMVSGFLFCHFRSIVPAFAFHATFNMLAFLWSYYLAHDGVGGMMSQKMFGADAYHLWFLASITVFAGCILWMLRRGAWRERGFHG